MKKTFRNWKCTLDPNRSWIKVKLLIITPFMSGVLYAVSVVERLCCFRNFSKVFVTGISGSAIKRDALIFLSSVLLHHCFLLLR